MCTQILTNLSVPSVIFADAVWYGSVRGGVQTGGGADDPKYSSFGSRWGIKGSSEVSEGLTSVYKFETRVGQGKASQDTNQLYVGLSGGFGSITLGQQSSAAYNHSGAIRDISNWHSHGDTTGSRISNALSYSYAAESFSMQVAAIMDGGEGADTDGAVDRMEFGMTVGLGDIGKVAIGYEKQEDSMTEMDVTAATVDILKKDGAAAAMVDDDGVVKNTGNYFGRLKGSNKAVDLNNIMLTDGHMVITVNQDGNTRIGNGDMTIHEDDGEYYGGANCGSGATDLSMCDDKVKYLVMVGSKADEPTKPDSDITPTYTVVSDAADLIDAHTATYTVTKYGYKASHISASFGLAGITVGLGHTTKDSNDPMMGTKEKTNFLGASGGIGDTGLSWNAWGRNVDGHDGKETSPWTVGLAKSLGGGATTFIEHTNADDGEDGTTSIALRVDF